MPLVSAFLFPRSHRTPSIMIRGEFFFLIPDPGKDAEDDGKLPREISLNTGFDFLFFFFFLFFEGFVPRFHPRISFPFLSLSLSLLFFFRDSTMYYSAELRFHRENYFSIRRRLAAV